ncbi:PAS domain-containing sensor histidine kinase [Pseudalkalibacillus hwajinpoensis]|uniref:histidine kinase n=1 Tax=Guptibacillus hwajinpoensis TaxID=208199 RepID=A0A4U1MPB0_9BACL|nr:PAS domain-containing sensor histidine kinase [Pseudalkalibacillus hwajinpoensis]TKD72561.1 PAS domain S-box protein [Pseudalkalibacillus hwajinpoensis]
MTTNDTHAPFTSSSPPPEIKQQGLRDTITTLTKYYEFSTTAVVVQKNGKWVYLNPSALNLLGYERLSEVQGKSIWNFIVKADQQMVSERIQASINGVNPGSLEQKWIKKDGTIIPLEVTAIPVANYLGQTTAIIKKVNQESQHVHDTLQHYRLITENMNEIVSLLDRRGNLLYVSPSYKDYSKDGIHNEIGQSSIKYVHEEDKEFVKSEFLKLVKYRKPQTIQYRLQKTDGTYRCIESQGICISGQGDCQFIVVSRDVTDRHLAESKLRLSELKHRVILEHSNDLICMMSHEGIAVYASLSYKSLLGYEQNEVVGKDILSFIHPEDYEKCQKAIVKLTETKQPVTTIYRKIHSSGHVLTLEAKGMAVVDDRGDANHFVFISRDITEKIKLEQYRENIEKLALLGDVAAGFAHEIRNPLTSIKGFINLLAKERNESERGYHQIIEDELEKIEEVVNGFIALAKPQAGDVAEVSLLKLVKNAISVLTPQASLKNIRININCQLKSIIIRCQRNQMKQVFINILKNAVEAIEEDGHIEIILEEQQDRVCVIIHDNGIGIEEERLQRIGVPFYTNKEKGIGLGMTVSNKIITEHKGQLEIESKQGEGTKVVIHLPKYPF